MLFNKIHNKILNEQIKIVNDMKLSTKIDEDMYDVEGKISNIDIFKNKKEHFIIVHIKKNNIWNEECFVVYDESGIPLNKLAFSYNKKNNRISFDYFFTKKTTRNQGLGQFMVDYLFDYIEKIKNVNWKIFVNPYYFEDSFNGVKSYDYKMQLNQYKLEQFYLKNNFLLTERPKDFVFGNETYNKDEYNLTPYPISDNLYKYIKKSENYKENSWF